MKNLKMILVLAYLSFVLIGNASNFKTEIIYFDVAKSEIKNLEKEKLEKLSKANQIYLVGHTDSDGDDNYNKTLSESRVKTVFNFLIQNGFAKDKIDLEYYGESKPLNENSDETQKSKNRRVEVKYIIDPLMDFEVEKQFFDINDDSETIIKGRDGTEIIIPANTFDAKNVKLELQEFYSNLDIMSSNLSTKANGELLETSGMIFLEAISEGEKVEPTKDLTIKFNKMSEKQDFQLFEGNRSKSDLDMNWNRLGAEINDQEEVEGLNAWTFDYSINDKSDYSYDWFDFFTVSAALEFNKKECYKAKMKIRYNKHGMVDFEKSTFETTDSCKSLIKENLVNNLSFQNKKVNLDYNVYTREQEKILSRIENLEKLNTKESLAEADKIRTIYESDKIVTSSNVLGWINCDRFINYKNNTDYVVKISDEMNVRMIVDRYNSFFNSYKSNDNEMTFSRIPVGEKVTLICTSSKNGKILLAIEETTIGKKPFSDFNFKVVSKEELKKEIESI